MRNDCIESLKLNGIPNSPKLPPNLKVKTEKSENLSLTKKAPEKAKPSNRTLSSNLTLVQSGQQETNYPRNIESHSGIQVDKVETLEDTDEEETANISVENDDTEFNENSSLKDFRIKDTRSELKDSPKEKIKEKYPPPKIPITFKEKQFVPTHVQMSKLNTGKAPYEKLIDKLEFEIGQHVKKSRKAKEMLSDQFKLMSTARGEVSALEAIPMHYSDFGDTIDDKVQKGTLLEKRKIKEEVKKKKVRPKTVPEIEMDTKEELKDLIDKYKNYKLPRRNKTVGGYTFNDSTCIIKFIEQCEFLI